MPEQMGASSTGRSRPRRLPDIDLRVNFHNLAGMTGSRLSAPILLAASLLAVGLVCIALWAGWSYSISAQTQRGAALYAEHCGMCHGAQLEGQPD